MTVRRTIGLLFLLVIAVILGMNTTSKGISSLTDDNRKQVLKFDYHHALEKIGLIVPGQKYYVGLYDIVATPLLQRVNRTITYLRNYAARFWQIFYAVFLY